MKEKSIQLFWLLLPWEQFTISHLKAICLHPHHWGFLVYMCILQDFMWVCSLKKKGEQHREHTLAHDAGPPTTCSLPTDNLQCCLINQRSGGSTETALIKKLLWVVHFIHRRLFLLCGSGVMLEKKSQLSCVFSAQSACLFISCPWQKVWNENNLSNKKSRALQQKFVCVKDVCVCQSQLSSSTVLLHLSLARLWQKSELWSSNV